MTVAGPMQDLIDGLLEAVWLVDAGSLRIRAANAAAGTLFGVDAASLCGRGATELCATPEDLVFWSEASAGLVDQIVSDTLVRDAGGRLLPVTRRVSRIGDGLFLVTCRDRSAQRAAEEELETRLAELRATLESTADGILVTDLSGHIRSFNHRFAGLWALPEDVLARRDDEAVRDWMRRSVVDGADYERRLAAIQEATMLQTSDVFTLHSGRVLERLTLPQCTRGHPIGRVFSFRDITEKLAASARIE